MSALIPKVIHYCWFGGSRLPRQANRCMKSWKKFCPDYDIKLWNEENFDVKENQFCSTAYDHAAWAFVSDYVRLAVVSQYGGFYFDVDVELLRPIDPLRQHAAFVGVEQVDGRINTGLGFGAEVGNIAISQMLKQYSEITFSDTDKEKYACPLLNDDAIRSLGYAGVASSEAPAQLEGLISIYPPEYFDPISMGDRARNLLSSNSYSIHHAAYSWGTNRQKFKRKLANKIGLERADRLKTMLRKGFR